MTKIVEHKIELSNHKQIKLAPYKTAKSNSPYSSPVVLARKKNGEYRFCVDFRAINKITRKDAYPLPRVEESLQILRNNHFYITLSIFAIRIQANPVGRKGPTQARICHAQWIIPVPRYALRFDQCSSHFSAINGQSFFRAELEIMHRVHRRYNRFRSNT